MSRKSQTNTTTSIGNATPLIWRVLPVAPYFPAAHGEPEHALDPASASYLPAGHSEHVALADDVAPV